MSTDDLLLSLVEYDDDIRAFQVAFLVLLFIAFFLILLFLLCEIFIWTISLRSSPDPDPNHNIGRNRTTTSSDPETGSEVLNDWEIMETGVGSENQTLLRIHEALGALRTRNQQHHQQTPHGNEKRKGVLRSLPKPECYGSRYQRITNNTEEECVICLEEFVSGDVCRILPTCSHIFHLGCIDNWLLNHQLNCPVCRSSPIINAYE